MTELEPTNTELGIPEVLGVTDDAKRESLLIREQINVIALEITQQQAWLEAGWIRLGVLVHRVREKKYWLDYGYQNFPEFVQDIATRVNRKRSYIYQCKGIAEVLLPQLSAETLVDIGITKATELKKLAIEGRVISDEVIAKARSQKTHELKATVAEVINPSPEEHGKWFDLGGFYLTDEELALFEVAYDLALKDADDPLATTLPDHVEKKLVFMRWCAEYLTTYGGQNG